MLIHVAKYSLPTFMIEDMIEHETIATRFVTSSKPSKSPCADCRFSRTHRIRIRSRFIF